MELMSTFKNDDNPRLDIQNYEHFVIKYQNMIFKKYILLTLYTECFELMNLKNNTRSVSLRRGFLICPK